MKTLSIITLFAFIGFSTQQIKAQIITTIAGDGIQGYGGDGAAATSAELDFPTGVFADGSGNVFISDWNNNRIRKVNGSTGIITTIAGNSAQGYAGDGGAATNAELFLPGGVFVDGSGNVFIADTHNNRIRKVNGSTGIITTIAGNGIHSFAGDGGAATNAEFDNPTGIFVDSTSNVFIADSTDNRIRKVNNSTGIITTIAGNGVHGYSGDGGAATSAELNGSMGVFGDRFGNVFIADYNNNRIRKVNGSTGIISTIAGNGVYGYSGDGGAATSAALAGPVGVFVDGSGNVFIADWNNQRIRKVNGSSGIISTIAGNGTPGYAGDGAAATSAELYLPNSVFVDGFSNVFIADASNNRIRMVCNTTCAAAGIEQIKESNNQLLVYPNPASTILNVTFIKNTESNNTIKLINLIGETVYSNVISKSDVIDISNFAKGIYMLVVTDDNNTVTKKVIVE